MTVYKKLKELIESNAIGKLRFAQVSSQQNSTDGLKIFQAAFGYPIMGIERIADPKMGGGALLGGD